MIEEWHQIYSWVELLLTSIDCSVGSTTAVISSRWYLRPRCCTTEHNPTLMMNEAPSRTVARRTALLLSHSTSKHRTSEGQVTREGPDRSALHQSQPSRLFLGTRPTSHSTGKKKERKKKLSQRGSSCAEKKLNHHQVDAPATIIVRRFFFSQRWEL